MCFACGNPEHEDPARNPVDITLPAPITEDDGIAMTSEELKRAEERARRWVAQVGVAGGIV